MSTIELAVLINFLKSGFTTRQLDKLIGFDSSKSRGWRSWKILKKYQLTDEDRGALFCYRETEARSIIKELQLCRTRTAVRKILKSAKPRFFEKYRDIYITANTQKDVAIVLGGEARNITLNFFSPLRKKIGACQYIGCKNTNLETVHLKESRPEILMSACKYGRMGNTKKYNVYKLLQQYIQLHLRSKIFCFLCKEHHKELTKLENLKKHSLKHFHKHIVH